MDNLNNRFRFDKPYFDDPLRLNNFVVYQIGDLCCDCYTLIDDHVQIVPYEFTFIERGAGLISTDGHSTRVKTGQVYLSLLGDKHRLSADENNPMRYFYIAFDILPDSSLKPVGDYLQNKFTGNYNRILNSNDAIQYMSRILSEVSNLPSRVFNLEMLEANLTQLVISVYRDETEKMSPPRCIPICRTIPSTTSSNLLSKI